MVAKSRFVAASIIILRVRWYITYELSSRGLQDMIAERGVRLSHTTILRCVQHYIPEFDKKWNRFAHPVGSSWRADEALQAAEEIRRACATEHLRSHHRGRRAKDFFAQVLGD